MYSQHVCGPSAWIAFYSLFWERFFARRFSFRIESTQSIWFFSFYTINQTDHQALCLILFNRNTVFFKNRWEVEELQNNFLLKEKNTHKHIHNYLKIKRSVRSDTHLFQSMSVIQLNCQIICTKYHSRAHITWSFKQPQSLSLSHYLLVFHLFSTRTQRPDRRVCVVWV